MSLNETRCQVLALCDGEPDTRSAAAELSAEITQAARFSCGGLREFDTAVSALAGGEVTARNRALLSLMVSLSAGCETCTAKALSAAIRYGVTRNDIKGALKRGILMSGRPVTVIAAEALGTFDQITGARPAHARPPQHADGPAAPRRHAAHSAA